MTVSILLLNSAKSYQNYWKTKLVARVGETMVTTIATVDSMVHREVVVMEATEVAAVVGAVGAVAVLTAILSSNETTSTMMRKTITVGDLEALLITVTLTMLLIEVVGEEVRTLAIGDLGVDRAPTVTDPSLETIINRKTLAFHVEGLQLNTKLKETMNLLHQQAVKSTVFSFQISHPTTVRRT